MPLVRSASISGFAPLVSSLGGDPERLARSVGLPLEALTSTDLYVPLAVTSRAMELAAEQLNCPDFGLRLGESQNIEGLGPLTVALQHSPTLGDALECARRFLTVHNQASTLSLEVDPYDVAGVIGVRFAWFYDGSTYRQSMDKQLLNVHRVIQFLAGSDYGLRSVEMSYRPPALPSAYEAAFEGVRINLGRPRTMLRMPGSLLQQPIAGAQEMLRTMALQYLETQVSGAALPHTQRVRTALEALVGSGRTTVGWVATHVGVSARTMQRQLTSEGTTFGAVLDEVRRDKAEYWLTWTELSMAEIAAMLDFDNQATFSRAGTRWWGVPPSRRRTKRLAQSV